MSSADGPDLEQVLRAWPDADPPAALDRAVRRRAHAWLAQQRAVVKAEPEGTYPAWLFGLTAALMLLALALVRLLPAGRILCYWGRQALASLPLAQAWLALLASNLLAAILAPAVITWREAHGG